MGMFFFFKKFHLFFTFEKLFETILHLYHFHFPLLPPDYSYILYSCKFMVSFALFPVECLVLLMQLSDLHFWKSG